MVFERFEPVGVDCIPFSRDLKTRPTVCYITTYVRGLDFLRLLVSFITFRG